MAPGDEGLLEEQASTTMGDRRVQGADTYIATIPGAAPSRRSSGVSTNRLGAGPWRNLPNHTSYPLLVTSGVGLYIQPGVEHSPYLDADDQPSHHLET